MTQVVLDPAGLFQADHAEERRAFGTTVRVCSYEDLLEMKQAAGRDQDRIDIENLKAARREL